jgi:glycosyltransferase involved in cell wall biosynthesis
MISFIMPYINDREPQLQLTLQSLERQTDKDYEVILVEHEDTNPATAFNFGVGEAKGEIICLTSPEVFNASENVVVMHQLPANTYWVGWCVEALIKDVVNGCGHLEHRVNGSWQCGWYAECLKEITPMIKGVFAHCTEQDWKPWKYFLGVIHKKDYHLMDEYFTGGIAWEDRDWADRLTVKAEFNPRIVGIHLTHDRNYQHDNPTLRERNRLHYFKKRVDKLGRIYG